MKFNIELDITPEEVKELFEGNMDVLQRSLVELFMRQMSHAKPPSADMMTFWQSMAEKSTSMFEQYQNAMSSVVPPKK
ncbi:MAG: hypothetical protein K6L81_12305 [Agarilytica sp.]